MICACNFYLYGWKRVCRAGTRVFCRCCDEWNLVMEMFVLISNIEHLLGELGCGDVILRGEMTSSITTERISWRNPTTEHQVEGLSIS